MHSTETPLQAQSTRRKYLREMTDDLRLLNTGAGGFLRDYRWSTLTILFAVAVVAWLLKPGEMALLHGLQGDQAEVVHATAKQISRWGDIHTGTLMFTVGLWLTGLARVSRRLRQAALACLLAACLAGISADVFRYGLGRARPNAGVADGFYGLSSSSKYHAFPSGHTSTAFGTAVPVAVLFPEVAIPAVTAAAAVGWSRLYLNYHRPTDVLVGAMFGTLFGVAIGYAVRRHWRADGAPKD